MGSSRGYASSRIYIRKRVEDQARRYFAYRLNQLSHTFLQEEPSAYFNVANEIA